MRPRKKILLSCANPIARSAWTYTFEVRGFKVFQFRAEDSMDADLAVIIDDPQVAKVLEDQAFPLLAIVPLARFDTAFEAYPPRTVVVSNNIPNEFLIERMRQMTVRKRGPKQHVQEEVMA